MTDLQALSDAELVDSLRALEKRHRQTMATIVTHLIEIEERRLHLRLGYSSLFDYCQRALGLSEGESYRRMTVSRLARKWPALVEGLSDGSLHMSGVVLLKPHLRADNCDELLEMARGASRRQLERRLAARFPQADSAESVRAQRVKPLSVERFALQLTIGSETRARLERALELMSHENPTRSLETVIDKALAGLVRELERSRRGKVKRSGGPGLVVWEKGDSRADVAQVTGLDSRADAGQTKAADFRAGAVPHTTKPSEVRPAVRKRAIARPIRRQVFERDGEQCSFVGESGECCECRGNLELDHIRPWALGGSSEERNLRVLCRAHNRFAAEECFGKAYVEAAMTAGRTGEADEHAPKRVPTTR